MTAYLIIWGILPGLLLLLTIWTWIKLRILKGAKEQTSLFGKQFLFTLFAYLISVFILYMGVVGTLDDYLMSGFINVHFLEWLIYPVVLVVFAKLGDWGKE